jgi:hypothetical protein
MNGLWVSIGFRARKIKDHEIVAKKSPSPKAEALPRDPEML